MLSVRLHGVSFSFVDSVPILADLELEFGRGWAGVVGANGAGKSTLLRLLAGDLAPESGQVICEPRTLSRRLCPQTAELLTAAIEQFARAIDGEARRVTGLLRLDAATLARWPTLSPGERKRWQIGAALFAGPQLLMLDEPTDHLDADARGLLIDGLARFRGIGVVVSHDRELLDALTERTLRFSQGGARMYRGSYSEAKSAWENEERELLERHARVREEQRAVARRLADKRRHACAADPDSKPRVKDIRDHDARSMATKGKAEMASARISRDVGVLRAKLERVSERLGEFQIQKTRGRSLFVDYQPAPVPHLMTLVAPLLYAGDSVLLRDLHLQVTRQSRIFVAGPNGAGKTTLLRALLAAARVPASRLLYLPQEIVADEARALLDDTRELRGADRARVLTIVAALGVDPGRLLASRAPSPGEARKLALAYGLGRLVWGLVLDEPTNHLDMPAIERLQEALAQYPGALVIVTHDQRLAGCCTSTRWLLRGEHVEVGEQERAGAY